MAARRTCAATCQASHRISEHGIPVDVCSRIEGFRKGLRDLGYVEGTNITVEYRWAEGRYERLAGLAAELVRSKVDLIVTHGTPGSLAAKHATTTIPIVMASIGDPVVTGVIASVARPGGNITGQTFFNPELRAKRIELLKEVMPRLSQVAVILNMDNPANSNLHRERPCPAGRRNTRKKSGPDHREWSSGLARSSLGDPNHSDCGNRPGNRPSGQRCSD